MAFIVLKDITGKLQITVEKEKLPELCETLDVLTPDSVISVEGKLIANPDEMLLLLKIQTNSGLSSSLISHNLTLCS